MPPGAEALSGDQEQYHSGVLQVGVERGDKA